MQTPPAPPKREPVQKKEATPEEIRADTLQSVATTAVGLTALVGMGAASPGPAFSSMLTKFGLASICGYQTVWGECRFQRTVLHNLTLTLTLLSFQFTACTKGVAATNLYLCITDTCNNWEQSINQVTIKKEQQPCANSHPGGCLGRGFALSMLFN